MEGEIRHDGGGDGEVGRGIYVADLRQVFICPTANLHYDIKIALQTVKNHTKKPIMNSTTSHDQQTYLHYNQDNIMPGAPTNHIQQPGGSVSIPRRSMDNNLGSNIAPTHP